MPDLLVLSALSFGMAGLVDHFFSPWGTRLVVAIHVALALTSAVSILHSARRRRAAAR